MATVPGYQAPLTPFPRPDAALAIETHVPLDQATHVVLLTPQGRGALAVLVVYGPLAAAAVERQFRPAARRRTLSDFSHGRIVFGRWGSDSGEEIVVCRMGESQIEVSCHGGLWAARRILQDLIRAGCTEMSWRRWLELVGTEGAVEVEALVALAHARTERAASILLDQMQRAWQEEIVRLVELARMAPAQAAERVRVLLERAPLGMHLTDPWKIVLAGRPNVGKSSLINALVGYQRAIVFDQPGTTRDVLTAATAIEGWPVEMSDTAGLRDSGDLLEAAGVARAREEMQAADVLLLVFDQSQPWTTEDAHLLRDWPKAGVVYNKSDLAPAASDNLPVGLITSAATGAGIDALLAWLACRLVSDPPQPGAAVPFTGRQVQLLEQTEINLIAGRVPKALAQLQEILG